MPDPNGDMTKEEQDAADRFLTEKLGENIVCPACRVKADFGLSKALGSVDRSSFFQLPSFPTVMIQCLNCGLILQFSAVHIGVFKRQVVDAPSPAAGSDQSGQ